MVDGVNVTKVPRIEIREHRRPIRRSTWSVAVVGLNGEDLSTSESLRSLGAAYRNVRAQMGAFAAEDLPVVEVRR